MSVAIDTRPASHAVDFIVSNSMRATPPFAQNRQR